MQLTVNIMLAASTYFLLSVHFSLIHSVTHSFPLAQAAVFTAAAYFAYWLQVGIGLPLGFAIPIAVATICLAAAAAELGVYRPLRRRSAASLVVMLASLGIYVVVVNVISLVFGDEARTLQSGSVEEGMRFFTARVTPVQVWLLVTGTCAFVLTWLLLRFMRFGKALRAVSSNTELARIVGINRDRVILGAFMIGSVLAGLTGILVALDTAMTPTMGLSPLLMAIIAMLAGRGREPVRSLCGAFVLASVQQGSALLVSGQWQDPIAFALLLLLLATGSARVVSRRTSD